MTDRVPLCARDVMQPKVQSVGPEMSLIDLERAFMEARVTGFPVVVEGRLVGLVSHWDILRKLATEQSYAEYVSESRRTANAESEIESVEGHSRAAAQAGSRLGASRVKDVMSLSPVTVSPDTTVAEVARLLVERHIHRVPVTRDGYLEGIVTTLDLVQLIADSCGLPDRS